MSGTLKHARRELALLGYKPIEELEEDDPNRWVQQNILDLLEVFSKQGHSGSSAPYVIGMFFKLASHEPITPLTGEDSEWEKVDFQTFQNVRCSRVFKNINTGAVYDIQGRVFEEPDGSRFANNNSIVDITFPYTPNTIVVKVPTPDLTNGIVE
jgi:hypothetical protein